VITLQPGTYSAAGIALGARNGVTIICATERACTMTAASVFNVHTTSTYTNLMRISGFVFSNTSGGPTISLGWSGGDPRVDQLRIDHNTFRQTSGMSIATGHTQSIRRINGVIDSNRFEGSTHEYPLMILGAGNNDWGPSLQGTSQNLFVEDNVFNFANENLGGGSGMDSWNGGRLVVRYNQITNARVAVHGVCHGGPANFEVYNNTIVGGAGSNNGYRLIHHQGSGEFLVFNNVASPAQATMALLNYRSSQPNPEGCGTCDGSQSIDGNRPGKNGYPCYRQPGRTGDRTLRPVYVWNNSYSSGGQWNLRVESAGGTSLLASHLVANRDIYQAVSASAQTSNLAPFNGSSGMGFGTLANRPTTCVPTPEVLDAGQGGVAYFATDAGPQGTLYRCSGVNTWTVHYQPYTYPHPLRNGGGGASAAPAAPSNLRITPNS
jgi:hypothetical protein